MMVIKLQSPETEPRVVVVALKASRMNESVSVRPPHTGNSSLRCGRAELDGLCANHFASSPSSMPDSSSSATQLT